MNLPRCICAAVALVLLVAGCSSSGDPLPKFTLPPPSPIATVVAPTTWFTQPPAESCPQGFDVAYPLVTQQISEYLSLKGMTVCGTPDGRATMISNHTNHLWVLSSPALPDRVAAMLAAEPEQKLYQTVSSYQTTSGMPIRAGERIFLAVSAPQVVLTLDPAATAATQQYNTWVASAQQKGVNLVLGYAAKRNNALVRLVGSCMKVTYGLVTKAMRDDPGGSDLAALKSALTDGYSLTKGAADCANAFESYREVTPPAQRVALLDVEVEARNVTAPLADDLLHQFSLVKIFRAITRR